MLSSDTLTQLSALKKEIRASRDVAQGTVRGTSGRYGFVALDDGRDAFLNPEQMDRVFHGDRVEVSVTQNDKEQNEAKLEKLIFSPLKQLAGRYAVKGKGHFVIYENQQYSRWVFVPPKERAQAKDGLYVTARITQHPFNAQGKAQAKIIQVLGDSQGANIARKYTLAMHQLFEQFPRDIQDAAKALTQHTLPTTSDNRADRRDIPFVTIDSATTRDMDDALYAEQTADGWILNVAIADPGCEIASGTDIDQLAQRRGHTLYLPGKAIPMLPETLSTERYSLISHEDRPALICSLTINKEGSVTNASFEAAIIQCKGKLSYQQVSALLNEEEFSAPEQLDDATPFKEMLCTLRECSAALNAQRKAKQIVNEYRNDYLMLVNNEGKLESVEKLERSFAHPLVEEAMIATNQAAGEFLAKNKTGLFTVHPGYREERREDIEKLLVESLGDLGKETATLAGFIKVMQTLQNDEQHSNLLAIQQRFQQGSELATEATAHFGLGANYYATITSPIRRYQDLFNQRCIHSLLTSKKAATLSARNLERLQETLKNNRSANRVYEQWLLADYMQSFVGKELKGHIALLTNQGVGIRLDDTGAEGFIAAIREDKNNSEQPFDKLSFNNQRMELVWNETPLFLDQEVTVRLQSVDMEKKKLILEWVEPSLSH